MKSFSSNDIRQKYLEFFASKGHAVIPSGSLIPENDPTVLFTTAGMQPLVPYLLGEKHPQGSRLCNAQKCIRTGDIEEVGDKTHLTFFEMLGNWSLGDYFKREAIEWSFEFLTKGLELPISHLAVSVFEGENNIERDEESATLWKKLGIPGSRIVYLGREDNWWGPAGKTGPCGPDTEMFYWTGTESPPQAFDPEDARWVEIWNDVFMQFLKTKEGNYELLSKPNVDTGMGLERITAVLQGKSSVYETEIFLPILKTICVTANIPLIDPIGEDKNAQSVRIIADHLRAAVFIISDGITPSNVDQGYVLRRLIRRAIRHGRTLGIQTSFTSEIAKLFLKQFQEVYPNLLDKNIENILQTEEDRFRKTLETGVHEFEKVVATILKHTPNKREISGKMAFKLYDTYGFPLEITEELAQERDFTVDTKGFTKSFQKHQELSRQGAAQKFKGGLSDDGEKTTALHTATHLLLAGLQKVLGENVTQCGSNITAERLRFDFSYPEKMTKEQLLEVEQHVNEAIAADAVQTMEEMDKEEAKKTGVTGAFWERYPDIIKVFTFTDTTGTVWSREICGGPHTERTSLLGTFHIKKEESSSAGVRRIKAVLKTENL